MGCCNSQESLPQSHLDFTKSPSLTRHFTTSNSTQLTKKFSTQVNSLKSLSSFHSSILSSGITSMSSYKDSLQSLPFYFSQKSLECFETLSEDLTCPECQIAFNDSNELPLTLTCEHLMCKSCCEHQFKIHGNIPCSFSCIPSTLHPNSLPVNVWILEMTKSINEKLFCFTHLSTCRDFCVNCKKVVCKDCAESHLKHTFVQLASEEFNKELENWKKNLKTYSQKIEENKQTVEKHKQKFVRLQQSLEENLEEHCKSIVQATERTKVGLIQAADSHIESLDSYIREMITSAPVHTVKLYQDSIRLEIEKATALSERLEMLNIGAQLQGLSKVELKNLKKSGKCNFKPWETLEKELCQSTNFEFLLLSLAGMQLNLLSSN